VDFDKGKEPHLLLTGETTVTDSVDNDHVIKLTLKGFLSRIVIDLTSDTGLEKGQIMVMLATGRTTDAARKETLGRGHRGAGAGSSGAGAWVSDPALREFTASFTQKLAAKPIKDITKLDLFRIEMGTDTVRLRAEKRLGRYVKLVGETEFGLLGRQRQEIRAEVKLHDNFFLDLKGRRLIQGEDVFENEDPLQGRIQLRYRLRLRGGLVRSLGF
jgi:hypothetical protein